MGTQDGPADRALYYYNYIADRAVFATGHSGHHRLHVSFVPLTIYRLFPLLHLVVLVLVMYDA